jgi:predicted dehydrogenase
MKLALIGAGQRGMLYAEYAYLKKKVEIVAVIEPNEERRKKAGESLKINKLNQYASTEEFFAQKKMCDAVIIASMDKNHFEQAVAALNCGYDILLEKPISPNPKECIMLSKLAQEKQRKIIVCHVLRYTQFFSTIKEIINSGELGRVVTIQHNENIGNWHMAHSFVRGNWRRSDTSSPLIMQKSCHDMDILTWLVESEAEKIASFGSLSYFKEENAPLGSAMRCLECKLADECTYNAAKVYTATIGSWPSTVLGGEQSKEGILKTLETSDYGRCVFHCDNTVCDNQVTIITFKNGVNVTFTLSGLTSKVCRTLKIMCEQGEIRAEDDGNTIEVIKFNTNAVEPIQKRVIQTYQAAGHGGGDNLLMGDFILQLESNKNNSKTAITRSIESHLMAYAAEQSRLTGKIIYLDELKQELTEK